MITASNTLKDLLEKQTSITINTGCTLEHNMNSLVENITMTGADIIRTDVAGNTYFPFKKLFPIDAVIKPDRPIKAGVKYAIVGDVAANTYKNPRVSQYQINFRTYYPGSETSYKYYVSDKGQALDVTATYPKSILTNKIIVKFELAHSTPPSWTIYSGASQLASGTSSSIKAFGNADAGTVTIYYNGTSWSTTEPATPATPISMTSLRVTAGAVTGKYIGLIEMSPRWIRDITDRVTNVEILKDSSSGPDDVLPVGLVSANSLDLSMVSYEDTREIVSFNKSMTFDSTKTYLYKGAEIKPYFKIYYTGAPLTDSLGTYEKVPQGFFYLDSYSIGEFGDVSLSALDGARVLQQIVAPGIVCKDYTTIGIIRTLLDNVGFTNYNFNSTSTDKSIFAPRYWYTNDSETVWTSIQDLCRDSQMVATFDENNILQFYTREYLFSSVGKTPIQFRDIKDGDKLPNILSFNNKDMPSANQAKVLWKSHATNNYLGNSQPIWSSQPRMLGALSLEDNLPAITGYPVGPHNVTNSYVRLKQVTSNDSLENSILNEYSGYLAIDSEIIEYDAIEYNYVDSNGNLQTEDITTKSDALKYLGLSKPGSGNFKPSGKYRIKTRGAFQSKIQSHVKQENVVSSWSGYDVIWDQAGGSTPTQTNVVSSTSTTSKTQTPSDTDWNTYIKNMTNQGINLTNALSSARYAAMAEYYGGK